ncbi:MAG: tRNA lysidine(34) synthetase TilS [Phycisphaerales bacterium]|jgi:tRNA(Ile)-lysidine synthase|nr:tRNA lysidine(34) synthetase TilS [Phycisphaerales bacterium]
MGRAHHSTPAAPGRPLDPRSRPRAIARSNPETRRVLARWRELTGGSRTPDTARATLVACSAGADSCALAVLLASSGARIVLGHVQHDLRPPDQTGPDTEHVRSLAQALGVGFALAQVAVPRDAGNLEQSARRARYAALAQLARDAECPYIATAHHAGDQLETLLMRLMRGSGPRGLAGIPPTRRVRAAGGVKLTIVRPMLASPRTLSREVCGMLSCSWREDSTNADTRLLRNALRARVAPEIERLCPTLGERLESGAESLRAASLLLEREAERVLGTASFQNSSAMRKASIPTSSLAGVPAGVVGASLRLLYSRLTGLRGDRLPARTIGRIASAIADQPGEPREFVLSRVRIRVDARAVTIESDAFHAALESESR